MGEEHPQGGGQPDARETPRPRAAPTGRAPVQSTGAEYAGLGLQLGGAIALFAFFGWWLDERLGTSPWLLLALVFLGAFAGFYSVYRRVFPPGRGKDR